MFLDTYLRGVILSLFSMWLGAVNYVFISFASCAPANQDCKCCYTPSEL